MAWYLEDDATRIVIVGIWKYLSTRGHIVRV